MNLVQSAEAPEPKRKPIPNLLRPSQVKDNQDELKRLESQVNQPHIQDKGAMLQQIQRLKSTLDTLTPRPYSPTEVDAAAKRERELRAKLVGGMLTQAEMRANPPGAVDHHSKWEQTHKGEILEWKHIRLRLGATEGDHGEDVANLERFRPQKRMGELNMDVAQIEPKSFVGLEHAGSGIMFDEDEIAKLKAVAPEIVESLATYNNDQRAVVKEFISQVEAPAPKRGPGRPPKKSKE